MAPGTRSQSTTGIDSDDSITALIQQREELLQEIADAEARRQELQRENEEREQEGQGVQGKETSSDELGRALLRMIKNFSDSDRQGTPSTDTIREPKMKEPDTFDGSNRELLVNFLTEIQVIFDVQRSKFPDDSTKILYTVGLLRGNALRAVQTHLYNPSGARPDWLSTFDKFRAYLRLNFGDPDERGTARRKFKNLRQTGSASAYFTELQQLMAILRYDEDRLLLDEAMERLKTHLKTEIARVKRKPSGEPFDSLSELMEFIIPLDNLLYEDSIDQRKFGVTTRVTTTIPTPAIAEAPRSSSQIPSGNQPVVQTQVRQDVTTSGNNGVYLRGQCLPPDLWRKRNEEGSCAGCGQFGHFRRNCPADQGGPRPVNQGNGSGPGM